MEKTNKNVIKQIVERIKAVPNETKLLVLDPDADVYYRERDILVSSSQSNVVFIKTPTAPRAQNDSSDDDDDYEVKLRSKGSRVSQICVQRNSTVDIWYPSRNNEEIISQVVRCSVMNLHTISMAN